MRTTIAGIEDRNAVSQPPVEDIGPGKNILQDLEGIALFLQQFLVEREADGAGFVAEDPFVFFFMKQVGFKLVVFQEIVEKLPPNFLGNDEQGMVVAGAGQSKPCSRFDVVLDAGYGSAFCAALSFFAQQLRQFTGKGRHTVDPAGQAGGLQPPDHLEPGPLGGIGILFEFEQQVVEKGGFAAAVRPVENIDLVLLITDRKRLHMADQPVGKEAVGKKRPIRALDKEPAAIVVQIVD